MFKAQTVDNFLSKKDCKYLINTLKEVNTWEIGGSSFWDNRSLSGENIYDNIDKKAGSILYDLVPKIEKTIKDLYNEKCIYPELIQVIRWFPGMEQHPHCDDMTNSKGYEAYGHRHYGSILYLNNDYSGGHTFYPNHNIEIIPQIGTLAIHPGDLNHLHGVTKIKNNIRYTIASFWTRDKKYHNEWNI